MRHEEPEGMKEIHRIREKQYEETKHMTAEERIAYDREKTGELIKRFGIKLRTLTPAHKT